MIFLIDGNHACCRDRFGAGRSAIADLTKRRVQAIYRKWKPKQVIACFDQGKSFRHDLFSQYKSGRSEIEGIQFDLEVARLAYWCSGVLSLSIEGYEADDVIASYASQYDGKVMVFSGDKDLHQLIEEGRVLQVTSAKSHQGTLSPDYVNHDMLYEKYEVTPDQWVDYRCLTGDSSDAIAGCTGVGPKGAVEVLSQCETLSEFYKAPSYPVLKPALRTRLLEFQSEYATTRRLITLRRDLDVLGREK